MRGLNRMSVALFFYVGHEERAPASHLLRAIEHKRRVGAEAVKKPGESVPRVDDAPIPRFGVEHVDPVFRKLDAHMGSRRDRPRFMSACVLAPPARRQKRAAGAISGRSSPCDCSGWS